MFYNENIPLKAAKPILVEWRGRIEEKQKNQLIDFEERLGIPQAVLIRMALDTFLPKLGNSGFSEKGIRAGYLNRGY